MPSYRTGQFGNENRFQVYSGRTNSYSQYDSRQHAVRDSCREGAHGVPSGVYDTFTGRWVYSNFESTR